MVLHHDRSATTNYHRRRAAEELRAAATCGDTRARLAHLHLAREHEVATWDVRKPTADDYGLAGVIGNSLRLAMGVHND
jgi:hypothetical protein